MTAAVIDQATHLRSLMQTTTGTSGVPVQQQTAQLRRRAAVIAITSGKGGVGKSNIAVNLAIKLSMAGKETVLLDADLGLANADVLCNMDLRSNLSHVIGRHKTLQDVIVTGPGGFGLIGGASGLARMADLSDLDRQRLVDAMAELEQRADVILIDTGAGISPNVLTFTRAADHVLVVTTPEPTAITDAYAVIKVIARQAAADGQALNSDAAGQRMSLLVNQVRTAGEARVVHERIAKVARQFLNVKVFDAGYVLHDEAVSDAVRRRTPFVVSAPRSAAAQCIAHLAMRLEQGVAAAPMQPGSGFFERMGRWFKR
jgi:flagellar biosynthesis protein FlhG